VKKMEKTKAVILLIVASILVAAVAGIAFAQFAGAQAANNSTNQIPQGAIGNYYQSPQQEFYGLGQSAYPYGYGMGMGMCGRW
jgi:flagellar basal body-associated protein FliL